jgi:SAM-dependent methyltransferase
MSILLAVALLAAPPEVKRDVPYVPTPPEVVAAMVKLAGVRSGDVVYDLGCGDGRIVIAAVQVRGVRGVCVDIDPERIHESRQNAQIAGVADRIRFVQGNLFEVPIEGATVVMIYLLPEVNLRLRPRLLNELRPGTRVVSHRFDMGDWKPQRRADVELPPYHYAVYRWVVPMRGAARRP